MSGKKPRFKKGQVVIFMRSAWEPMPVQISGEPFPADDGERVYPYTAGRDGTARESYLRPLTKKEQGR